jgi:hypothetical protein
MDKRSSTRRKKKDSDFATIAFRVVQEATAETDDMPTETAEPEPTTEERHAMAVALGRLGGKKGGKARAAKLTPEQRSEIARKAAGKRWQGRH